jgi:hypothetical protein
MQEYMDRFGFGKKPPMDYPDGQMSSSGPRSRKGTILPMSSDQVDVGRTLQRRQRGFAGGLGLDLVALPLEQLAQQDRRVTVVLDDQDARGLGAHGTTTP